MYYIDRILDHRSNGAKTEYHVLWEATEMTPTGDSTWESSDRVRRTHTIRDRKIRGPPISSGFMNAA